MRTLIISILAAAAVAACSTSRLPISPYKIDVQQGNVVDQDMLDKLKPGMTRSQVRFLLGTPLIVDPFRKDRWDYVFSMHKNDKLTKQDRVTLFFDEDVLTRVETRGVQDGGLGKAPPAASQAIAPSGQTMASGPKEQVSPAAAGSTANADTIVPSAAASGVQTSIVPPLEPASAVASTQSAPSSTPAGESSQSVVLKSDTDVAAVAPAGVSDQPRSADHPADESAVLAAVHDWAAAWSSRSMKSYQAAYSTSFKPADGRSLATWRANHRDLFKKVKRISVEIESPVVQFTGNDRAVVTFAQHYQSDRYSSDVTKQLTLESEQGKWLIQDERVVPASSKGKP